MAITGLAHVDAPHAVTSAEMEWQMSRTYERLGIEPGLLEGLSGIAERRVWDEGTRPSTVAAQAGELALALQAHLPEARPVAVRGPLLALAADLRGVLGELAAALREGRPPAPAAASTSSLEALREALDARVAADPSTALDAAVLDVETASLVAAAAAVTDVLRRRATSSSAR